MLGSNPSAELEAGAGGGTVKVSLSLLRGKKRLKWSGASLCLRMARKGGEMFKYATALESSIV
jgi:hypothetical protein